MKRLLPLVWIVFFAATLELAAESQAPTNSAPVDSAVAGLADQMAARLHTAAATRILVLDLRGPQNENHPIGKWLADQLSLALQASSPEFVVLDRGQINEQSLAAAAAQRKAPESDNFMALGRSLVADTVIQGTYAKYSQRLGIRLTATNPARFGPFAVIIAPLPISAEMVALSPDPIPTFKGGILQGGVAGSPIPSCVYCPNPDYSAEARKAKLEGIVILQVTINSEGRVVDAVVTKGPGHGLEQKAMEAVKNWQFKPLVDLDGNPASVSVSVEVSFRLLRGPH